MKIKMIFIFILFILLKPYGYAQIKELKHTQLPVYVDGDTIVIYDCWVQTAKEEAKQLQKIDKLEKKLDKVSVLLHKKKALSMATKESLKELDSLKAQNDSLRSTLDSIAISTNNDLKHKVNALNSRNKVLQTQVYNLRKVKRRLKRYCFVSSAGLVGVVLIVVLI